jgi:polar amino acid transport system substrate-binding protein
LAALRVHRLRVGAPTGIGLPCLLEQGWPSQEAYLCERHPAWPDGRRLCGQNWLPRLLLVAAAACLVTMLAACDAVPTPTAVSTLVPSVTPTPTATAVRPPSPTPTQTPLPVLRAGVDAANRPWCYRSTGGELVGLDVELLTALAAQMGVRMEYVNIAPHLLLPGLAAKKYDLAAAGLAATPERQNEAALSEPYFTLSQAVIVKVTDAITSTAELAGKAVGVQIGSAAVAEARRLGATVRLYDDLTIALGALARGEVRAVIGDDLGAADYLAAHPEARLSRAGAALAPAQVALAVARDRPDLLSRVNAGLAALRRSGALDQLALKWLR